MYVLEELLRRGVINQNEFDIEESARKQLLKEVLKSISDFKVIEKILGNTKYELSVIHRTKFVKYAQPVVDEMMTCFDNVSHEVWQGNCRIYWLKLIISED